MSKTGSAEHTVLISKDLPIQDVNIRRGESVAWQSQERDPCLVVFEQGSPFPKDWNFKVPGNGTETSGPANRDLRIAEGDHLVYKYSVIFNGWKADPKVKVWP